MFDFQESYRQKVRARAGNRVERSYSCLCCRDQALIPGDVVRRYIDPEFDAFLMGEIAFFCQNRGCDANNIVVHTQNGSSETCRYAANAAAHNISPNKCQQIHQLEWKRMRASDKTMKSASPLTEDIVNEIAKPMPSSFAAAPTYAIPVTTSVAFDK
jgi:diaminopimelate decarboxylase